jgi:hypothetical protein
VDALIAAVDHARQIAPGLSIRGRAIRPDVEEGCMRQYLLSVCYPAGAPPPSPVALERIRNDLAVLRRDMHDAGVWIFAGALEAPESATVVRSQDGQVLITDGPFVESKELIGGICVIQAADLDEALRWGAKMSAATTTPVEVRPIQPHRP